MLRFWFPVVLYSGIIFYMSSLPNVKIEVEVWHFDKIMHLLEYLLFGYLLARAFFNTQTTFSKTLILSLVIMFSFLYGISDEYHQSFVIGRHATLGDVWADFIGGIMGGSVYLFIHRQD